MVRIDQLPESTFGFAVRFDKIDRRENERRAIERVALSLKGIAVLDIGGQRYEREVTTKDLSVEGAYFWTDLCPSPSDRVSLRLTLVEREALFEASGKVVRVDPISENSFGVAVKFDRAQNID